MADAGSGIDFDDVPTGGDGSEPGLCFTFLLYRFLYIFSNLVLIDYSFEFESVSLWS